MKENLLEILKEELKKEKEKNEKHNQIIRRIKELKRNPNVREYIGLVSLMETEELRQLKLSDSQIITNFYNKYIHKIQKNETNDIFVYLGTYQYSYERDIIHGSNDIRVNYDSPQADYRIYKNIENAYIETISIEESKKFESEHIIIKPNTYFKEEIYYEIQKDFFIKAVKEDQESAKKMILRKYNK